MKTACLYIRVSTDEQAITGYSLRSQEDRLLKFCLGHGIEVVNTIQEDHSAKDFNRPGWTAMMSYFKRHRSLCPDLLLFTKWDRFSRNAGDAYYMMTQLKKMNIEPRAIDQALDLSIPENKIILGVYLSASEAENERRSINIKQGIHKAKQEGRWPSHAPLGYGYQLTDKGQKKICPKEPEAIMIRKSFTSIAANKQSVKSVYDEMIQSGLKCSISHFWRIIRNPIYCGKILVPAFENEKAYLVNGQHEAIIPDSLFNEVQNRLNNQRRIPKPAKQQSSEHLVLRGFIYCPICHRRLTGSASKGKTLYYYYYHCASTCSFRVRSDTINALFIKRLQELHVNQAYTEIYKDVIKYIRKDLFDKQSVTRKNISQHIDRQVDRIIKARDLLLKNEIEVEDFQIIKADGERRITLLGMELQGASALEAKKQKDISDAIQQLSNIADLYKNATLTVKKELLTMILTEKPVLDQELNLSIMASTALRNVYNIHNNVDESTKIYNRSYYQEGSYIDETINKVVAAEQKQGRMISKQRARETVFFLMKLARVAP